MERPAVEQERRYARQPEDFPGFVAVIRARSGHRTQPDRRLLGREWELAALRAFVTGRRDIAVVIGESGAGKSRMLRELPEALCGLAPPKGVWFRRPGGGQIERGLLERLEDTSPTVIVLDDAAMALSEVQTLVRLACDLFFFMKVVLLIRPAERAALEQVLAPRREAVEWLELGPIPEEHRQQLALAEHAGLSPLEARRLATQFPTNLFLLRAAAHQRKRGKKLVEVEREETLRALLVEQLIQDAAHALPALCRAQVEESLLQAALGMPVAFDSAPRHLKALIQPNVLRREGTSLRFRSEVEPGALLAHLFASEPELWRRAIGALVEVEHLLPVFLRNLRAAGPGPAASLMRVQLARWRETSSPTSADLWRLLALFAPLAPAEIAVLAMQELGSHPPSLEESVRLVLAIAEESLACAIRLMDLLLASAAVDESASQFFERFKKPLFHTVFRRLPELIDVCDLVRRWVAQPLTKSRSSLCREILEALLDPALHWTTSAKAAFAMHEPELSATRAIRDLHRRVTTVIYEMLPHPERHAREDALKLLFHREPSPRAQGAQGASLAAATREAMEMVQIFQARLAEETDLALYVELYVEVAWRWAQGQAGADAYGALIRGQELVLLAKAYQFASCHFTRRFFSFHEVIASNPTRPVELGDGWMGWENPLQLHRLIKVIIRRYRKAEDVIACARLLLPTRNPLDVLEPWCKRVPALFRLAEQTCDAPAIRDLLRKCLRRYDYELDPELLFRDLDASPQPVSADRLLALLDDVAADSPARSTRLARILVEHPEVSLRAKGLALLAAHGLAAHPPLDTLLLALRDGAWDLHWHKVGELLTRHPDTFREQPALRRLLLDRLAEFTPCPRITAPHLTGVLEVVGDEGARMELLGELVLRRPLQLSPMVRELLVPYADTPERAVRLLDHLVLWYGGLGEDGISAISSLLGCLDVPTFLIDTKRLRDIHSELLDPCLEMLRADDLPRRVVGLLTLSLLGQEPLACATLADLAAEPGPLQSLAREKLPNFLSLLRVGYMTLIVRWFNHMTLCSVLKDAEAQASPAGKPFVADLIARVQLRLDEDRAVEEYRALT